MQVIINGEQHQVTNLKRGDAVPGAMLRHTESRVVMRVVCRDGDDLVLRNVRYPNLLEAVPVHKVENGSYLLVL